jgi:RimJ/RimL family protein N-acetyltransferase
VSGAPVLRTERLVLRGWRPPDREAFAAMNADPRVMEHFPGTMTRAESDAHADRVDEHFAEHGFGLWAVQAPGVADFIGFVGLSVPTFQAHFTPCVEIGWRLAFEHWGRGYSSEAATAALGFAFGDLGLDEVVSFTVPDNLRSRQVMGRLGMRRSPEDDFQHPAMPEGHPLRPHVLYRLTHRQWRARPRFSPRPPSRGRSKPASA